MQSSPETDLLSTSRRAIEAARSVWGSAWTPTRGAVAPGRIEILGNHVDYNGGPVLAAAIDRATVILSDDADSTAMLFADFPDSPVATFDLETVAPGPARYGSPDARDFVQGVIARSQQKGRQRRSGRAVVATSIPIGSGMSSSAALSVALTLLINEPPPTGAELVYDAQAAENWTGVPCGTMDQSASVFGQVIRFAGPEGTTSIAPELGAYCFVVVDSRVERTLGTSSYPVRVRECAEAVEVLEEKLGRRLGNLASLSLHDLASIEAGTLRSPLDARARHIVTEVNRVGAGEAALRERDWETFGRLMSASGDSSAGDYEISHPQVEALVSTMRAVPGVAGARMMGGGEGGAALALLRRASLGELETAVAAFFDEPAGRDIVVPLSFAPGARQLSADEVAALL